MPYSIDRYNGTTLTVIEDGTIDTTLDIKLIGKNYAGYGEVQNENFIHILENFSGTSAPPKPISGQIWFDSGTKKLKFYDAAKWRATGGAEVATSAPTGLTTGDFWWDSANDQLHSWNGSEFILIGPQGVAGAGLTQMRSRALKDVGNVNHACIEAVADGDVVFIINSDSEFDLDTTYHTDLATLGFGKVKTGVTMANTGSTGVTTSDHKFWGTASNSLKLNGFADTEFVKAADAQFTAVARFVDAGLLVGGQDDLAIRIDDDGVTPLIKNTLGDSIKFQVTSGGTQTPLTIVGTDILPGASATHNIGSVANRYLTVYASNFNGTATQANTLNVGGTYRSASVAVPAGADKSSIPARNAAGDIYAILFQGTATAARFADLAEKYLADKEYDVGTVIAVGGDKEVTASSIGDRAIGVISANPAFMMNSELEGGVYVALKGRVPVKVEGAVIKGQKLVAGNNGTAHVGLPTNNNVFAVALETSNDPLVKLVECIIL